MHLESNFTKHLSANGTTQVQVMVCRLYAPRVLGTTMGWVSRTTHRKQKTNSTIDLTISSHLQVLIDRLWQHFLVNTLPTVNTFINANQVNKTCNQV